MILFSTYTLKQEKANIITHALGMLYTIPAGFILLHKGSIYASNHVLKNENLFLFSLLCLCITSLMGFTSSVMYHGASPYRRLLYRKWDHISIFWSITGFYLPFIVFNYEMTGKKLWLMGVMVGLATLGTLFKLFFLHVNKLFYTLLYLAMGWIGLFFGTSFFNSLPKLTIFFVLLGGVFYTIGVLFYLSKKIYYSHAIWHIFVLMGSVSHFFSVYFLLDS